MIRSEWNRLKIICFRWELSTTHVKPCIDRFLSKIENHSHSRRPKSEFIDIGPKIEIDRILNREGLILAKIEKIFKNKEADKILKVSKRFNFWKNY